MPAPWPYAEVSESDVHAFVYALNGDHSRVLLSEAQKSKYSKDWTGRYVGEPAVVLLPKEVDEVSAVLKHCNKRRIAVVPQGGNTGLVGGATPVFREVIIALERMNRLIDIDKYAGFVVCEAGMVLEQLESVLSLQGLIVPLDLGAKGKCQIGGCVSTNAGGLRFLRYGSLRGTILGLEIVLPSGEVLDLIRTLKKDNTGYDCKQLFIGAEGTLGVVTRVAISTPRACKSINVAVFGLRTFRECLNTLDDAQEELGEILSAFEFFDRDCLDLVLAQLRGTRDPFPHRKYAFYVLVETRGSVFTHDTAKLHALLRKVRQKNTMVDGVIASDERHILSLWGLRERISLALKYAGVVYKYDLSLPVAGMYDLVSALRERLNHFNLSGKSEIQVLGYGHMGDGNLHLNITCPKHEDSILQAIEPFVYQFTREQGGSISAEHGLGIMKAEKISYSKNLEAIRLMVAIKQLLDPHGIMNPMKVLPVPLGRLGSKM